MINSKLGNLNPPMKLPTPVPTKVSNPTQSPPNSNTSPMKQPVSHLPTPVVNPNSVNTTNPNVPQKSAGWKKTLNIPVGPPVNAALNIPPPMNLPPPITSNFSYESTESGTLNSMEVDGY